MNNPKISVIVPVYNGERFMHRCIDNILAQTFTDFELIIVDDGSTDDTGAICDEYAEKDKRVKVFHKQNGGVSSARNVGLDNAKGEYLCFCDSDDFVDSDWLIGFVEHIPSELIIQGYKWQNENDQQWTTTRNEVGLFNVAEAMKVLFLHDNVGYLWCRCFNSSIIRDYHIRFNEAYILREDYEFITSYCTRISNVSLVSSCSYNYFMPDYGGSKYNRLKIANDIQCTLSILNNLYQIFGGEICNEVVHSEIKRLQRSIFREIVHGRVKEMTYYIRQHIRYKELSSARPSNIKEYIKETVLFLGKHLA